jgi:hypothetical protein
MDRKEFPYINTTLNLIDISLSRVMSLTSYGRELPGLVDSDFIDDVRELLDTVVHLAGFTERIR